MFTTSIQPPRTLQTRHPHHGAVSTQEVDRTSNAGIHGVDPIPDCLHLSRVVVETQLLADDYAAHRLFWRAYGLTDQSVGQQQPFRFRRELQTDAMTTYLVQSQVCPQWNGVIGLEEVQSRVINFPQMCLEAGDIFRFRLKAALHRNCTRTRKTVAIRDPADIFSWLSAHASSNGFEVEPHHVIHTPARRADHRSRIKNCADGNEPHSHRFFGINEVLFDGYLRVTHASLFTRALSTGIGPKAAYGYGLLSITR